GDTRVSWWLLLSRARFSHGLVLSFLCCGGLRELHSFPTRRSSDLKSVLNMVMMSVVTMGIVGVLWVLFGFSMVFGESFGGLVGKDRKSTRLNSSHVKSSYAVFCLKKKKTHIDYSGTVRPMSSGNTH